MDGIGILFPPFWLTTIDGGSSIWLTEHEEVMLETVSNAVLSDRNQSIP